MFSVSILVVEVRTVYKAFIFVTNLKSGGNLGFTLLYNWSVKLHHKILDNIEIEVSDGIENLLIVQAPTRGVWKMRWKNRSSQHLLCPRTFLWGFGEGKFWNKAE